MASLSMMYLCYKVERNIRNQSFFYFLLINLRKLSRMLKMIQDAEGNYLMTSTFEWRKEKIVSSDKKERMFNSDSGKESLQVDDGDAL